MNTQPRWAHVEYAGWIALILGICLGAAAMAVGTIATQPRCLEDEVTLEGVCVPADDIVEAVFDVEYRFVEHLLHPDGHYYIGD